MLFTVIPTYIGQNKQNVFYLVESLWDDWFEFSTVYELIYIDREGTKHQIGNLKIGQFKMEPGQRRPNLPKQFNELPEDFFSVGQDDSYYENLNRLGDDIRNKALLSLRDFAKIDSLFDKALSEKVTKISLLRFVTPTSVTGQFRRLANGGVSLSKYDFKYTAAQNSKSNTVLSLSFHVEPESNPPTNIHVLIGRNGVGKTHLLNNMITSIIEPNTSGKTGYFTSETIGELTLFASLVSVTFSAFDETEPLPERKDKSNKIKYSYVGLKRAKKSDEPAGLPKSPLMLKNEFVRSVESCISSGKTTRWQRALEMLETDPIFKAAEVSSIALITEYEILKEHAAYIFKNLSSGHKIVLLTITRLIELVEEKTLVLLDEPEAHLHPPLLSAFIRALSDLLIQRNGVALIATHSPVVLQEVPSSCVWTLRRTGSEAIAERLENESFGENVGVLTREVFGLEVTHSGFHKLLTEAIVENGEYEKVLALFNNELGQEAKAIVRAMIYAKNNT